MTKKKTAVATVTEASAQAVLRRRGASPLAAVEERVLRMRLGAAVPRKAEIETYLKLRTHQALQARSATPAARATTRTKDKIVRALRRRGPTR